MFLSAIDLVAGIGAARGGAFFGDATERPAPLDEIFASLSLNRSALAVTGAAGAASPGCA